MVICLDAWLVSATRSGMGWVRNLGFVLLALLVSGAATAQSSKPAPETVEFQSRGVRLKGFLWKPAGAGPFPAVVFNHGRSNTPQQHTQKLTITAAAQVLGPVFARHGYVFLYPFRRGEGPSADQGTFIGDVLAREEAARGTESRQSFAFGFADN
jgi:poly(3-hydroxybutyrate) depolymerase